MKKNLNYASRLSRISSQRKQVFDYFLIMYEKLANDMSSHPLLTVSI